MTAEVTLDTDRVLFFPVTPFDSGGRPALDVLADHIASRLDDRPGGVFPACGTGEYFSLSMAEYCDVVTTATRIVASEVPVFTGAGGPLGHAIECARIARDAGVDGLLVMPPYLAAGPQAGLVAYVEAVAEAGGLPVVVYHRGAARFTAESVDRLFAHPLVAGLKDGVGDLATAQEFSSIASRHSPRPALFNGLPTAELTQPAYDAVGIPYYSSAVFAMAPDIANAFLVALRSGDEERRLALLDAFYLPLVALRDTTPGFAVALIKAGVALEGIPVGSVRAPLVDPDATQVRQLADLLAAGRAVLS